jgi:hypothetical protein
MNAETQGMIEKEIRLKRQGIWKCKGIGEKGGISYNNHDIIWVLWTKHPN